MPESKIPKDEIEKSTHGVSESKSSLTNPVYWIIALVIVVWWKWDEILTYIN